MDRTGLLGIALSVVVAACGGDDAGVGIDAPPVPIDAADGPPACGISTTDFGSRGLSEGTARWRGPAGSPNVGLGELWVPLEMNGDPDTLYVGFWGGRDGGPPFVAGTYEMTGPALQNSTCMLCVTVGAGWVPGDPTPLDDLYMVTGGTVVVETIDGQPGGMLDVRFSDLTFGHARFSGGTSTPLNDGCVTAITEIRFTGMFESDASVRPTGQSGSLPGAISRRYSRQ